VTHYHASPSQESATRRSFLPGLLVIVLLVTGGGLFVKSTLAANIAISSGNPIEFGQAVSQTVACSGGQSLTITPKSSFVNAANGTGMYYLNSITVSNIPNSCYGVDFTINAYGDSSSTPVPILNSTTSGVLVHNNGGTFVSSYGTTISSGSGTFTLTITNPIALSTSVYKLVIQSSAHKTWTCAQGGSCSVGDAGPGGGTVFYVSAGFTCGENYSSTCKYMEAAPASWYPDATDKPSNNWASTVSNCYDPTAPNDNAPRIACNLGGSVYDTATRTAAGANGIANNLLIGMGLKNTNLIVFMSGAYDAATNAYAAGAARAYNGGGKADWAMPSFGELNQLCKYVRGEPWVSDDTVCSASGPTANLLGMPNTHFYSSSEILWTVDFPFSREKGLFINHEGNNTGIVGSGGKNGDSSTRPVRTF
jgi:hypothetical protein